MSRERKREFVTNCSQAAVDKFGAAAIRLVGGAGSRARPEGADSAGIMPLSRITSNRSGTKR